MEGFKLHSRFPRTQRPTSPVMVSSPGYAGEQKICYKKVGPLEMTHLRGNRASLPVNVRNARMRRKSSVFQTRAFLGGFSSKAEPIKIKLNFYEILHVSERASKETIFRSYERMISNPPDVGFAEHALQARTAILEGAIETLGTSSIRKEYDERLAMGAIDETIPPKYVSGVLILLHEAGQYSLVISAGTKWLKACSGHKFSKDVATVVSCSYLTSATEMIDARESLHDAKSNLMQAKSILEKFGGSAQVLDIVESTIKSLGPRVALELISSQEASKRHEGILLLPLALEEMKKDSEADRRSQQSWISYLDRVRQLLSAEELIELFNVAEKLFTDPRELYYVAVAHIAAGVDKMEPKLICTAQDLLIKAEKLAKKARSGEREYSMAGIRSRKIVEEQQRRSMGLCCTSLLLGDSGKAATFLGIRSDPVLCDRQIYTFVINNSRGSDTLLPGLCVLVERWINEVALTSFYKNPAPFSLNQWFEEPKITGFLEYNQRHDGILSVTKGFLASVFSPAINFFTSHKDNQVASSLPLEEDLKDGEKQYEIGVEPRSDSYETTRNEEPIAMNESKEGNTPIPEPPSVPLGSDYTSSSSAKKENIKYPAPVIDEMSKDIKSTMEATGSPVSELSLSGDTDLSTNENLYLKGMDLENIKLFDNEELPRPLNRNSIETLGGEESWIWSAYEARRVRWGRVTATALLLLAGISAPLGRLGGHSILTKYIPVARIGHNSSSMNKKLAYSIIKRWQAAKADALGKHYQTEGLPMILGETLAKEWTARAMDLKKKGLHYVHNSHQCKIRDIREISTGNHLVIADIKESIVIHRGDDSKPKTFPSSYRVQYKIIQTEDGWKLSSATVQS